MGDFLRRREMLKQSAGSSGFHLIDALISNRNQYIDTGVVPAITDDLSLTFTDNEADGADVIAVGCDASSRRYQLGVYIGDYQCRWAENAIAFNVRRNKNIKQTAKIIHDSSISKVYLQILDADGEVIETGSQNNYGSAVTTLSLGLFCRHTGENNYNLRIKMNFYELILTNSSGVERLHMYPALDANGVPCVWDSVSNQTFYNEGTGTFGYIDGGTVVNPT